MPKFKVYTEVSLSIEAEDADEAMLKAGVMMSILESNPQYEGYGDVNWSYAEGDKP